jgi:hypothetical protein
MNETIAFTLGSYLVNITPKIGSTKIRLDLTLNL